ncbi:hypothetical protein ACFLRM_05305 [Acidobacteriota bacterium]
MNEIEKLLLDIKFLVDSFTTNLEETEKDIEAMRKDIGYLRKDFEAIKNIVKEIRSKLGMD